MLVSLLPKMPLYRGSFVHNRLLFKFMSFSYHQPNIKSLNFMMN